MKHWSDASPRPARDTEPQYRQRPCKGHILVVEDNPKVLTATRAFLEDHGCKVTTASTLAEAIEHARDIPDLDLLVTDYHLTGNDTGRQVIAAVRALHGPTLKVIVISGDTRDAVLSFGDDRFLCWLRKPLHGGQLVAVLQKFLPPEREVQPASEEDPPPAAS